MCYALFVGMVPVLAIYTHRPAILWHLGAAAYILLCIGLCFHDQHFFASGGIGNMILSAPVIVALFVAESANKRFARHARLFAIPITLYTLTLAILWTIMSPCQVFIPVLFMPDALLEGGHHLFSEIFTTAAILSFGGCLAFTIAHRRAHEPATADCGTQSFEENHSFFDRVIPLKTKALLFSGFISILLVLFFAGYFLLETSGESGHMTVHPHRGETRDNPHQVVSPAEIIDHLKKMGCTQVETEPLVPSPFSHGMEPDASLIFPINAHQNIRLTVFHAVEAPKDVGVEYEFHKVTAFEARRPRAFIKRIHDDFRTITMTGQKPW